MALNLAQRVGVTNVGGNHRKASAIRVAQPLAVLQEAESLTQRRKDAEKSWGSRVARYSLP